MYSELGFLQTTLYATRTFLKEQQHALRNGKRVLQPVHLTSRPEPRTPSPSSTINFLSSDFSSYLNSTDTDHVHSQLFLWGCIPEVCSTPKAAQCFGDQPFVSAECIEKSIYAILQSGELVVSDVFQTFSSHPSAPCSLFSPVPALLGIKIRLVAGSDTHAICIAHDERAFVWGQNDYGQLGLGDTTDHATPQPNPVLAAILQKTDSFASVREIACGHCFSVMLSTSGHIFTWGRGESGRLGLGEDDNHNRAIPFLVAGPLEDQIVVKITTGSSHVLCLTDTGQVYTFGSNANGQLGISNNRALACAMVPTPIPFFEGRFVKSISAGFGHSAALVDSVLYTWGWGEKGQLGHGKFESSPIPREVTLPNPDERPVMVSCGGSQTAMLTYSGVLYTWGSNRFGQLGLGDEEDSPSPKLVTSLLPIHLEHVSCGFWQTVAVGCLRSEALPPFSPPKLDSS